MWSFNKLLKFCVFSPYILPRFNLIAWNQRLWLYVTCRALLPLRSSIAKHDVTWSCLPGPSLHLAIELESLTGVEASTARSPSHQSEVWVSCIPPISTPRGNNLSPLSLWGSLCRTRGVHNLNLKHQITALVGDRRQKAEFGAWFLSLSVSLEPDFFSAPLVSSDQFKERPPGSGEKADKYHGFLK